MAKAKAPPSKQLRILITNDDGIHAPGLKVLEKIAAKLSKDVWVVAPEEEQSGSAHSLSLANPLRLRKLSARKYAVRGTPSDCVLMAVRSIVSDGKKFDLVLSGVNRGQNVADDVTYSGTIAAAMEGTQLSIPSIAMSQAFGFDTVHKGDEPLTSKRVIKWGTGEALAPGIIKDLLKTGWPADVLININFPDCTLAQVKGIEVTRQGKRDQSLVNIEARTDTRANAYYWLGFERILSNPSKGTDLRAIYDRFVSVTPLHMDLTHDKTCGQLAKALNRKS